MSRGDRNALPGAAPSPSAILWPADGEASDGSGSRRGRGVDTERARYMGAHYRGPAASEPGTESAFLTVPESPMPRLVTVNLLQVVLPLPQDVDPFPNAIARARVRYRCGESGEVKFDCDWAGGFVVPAQRLEIARVDVPSIDVGGGPSGGGLPAAEWTGTATYDDTIDAGNVDPGAGVVRFDALFPEAGNPINPAFAPSFAFISRAIDGTDIYDVAQQPGENMRLRVAWGASSEALFSVGTITESPDHVRLQLTFISGTVDQTLADGEALAVRLSHDGIADASPPAAYVPGEISIAATVAEGAASHPPHPPTLTVPPATVAPTESRTVAFPPFARRVSLLMQYGAGVGTSGDAPLGVLFLSFETPAGDVVHWTSALAVREALFGDGVPLPAGADRVVLSNASDDPSVRLGAVFHLGV